MAEPRESWNELGDRLSALGLKLKLHWQEVQDEDDGAVKDALHRLGEAIEDAFDTVGAAAKDPAVKEDLRQAGQALVDALSGTFAQVSEGLQSALKRRS